MPHATSVRPAPRARRTRGLALAHLVAALVAAVAVALGGAALAGAQEPPPDDGRVFVLGDSVLVGAEQQLADTLGAAGYAVTFDANVGRTTEGGLERITLRRADVGSTIVILLGHNDGADPEIYGPDADALLTYLSDVPHVVWLTVHETRDYYVEANELLRTVAAGRPNVTVADWNAIAGTPGYTVTDGLHLTPAGAQAMADFVLAAVSTPAPNAAPTTTTAAAPAPGPETTAAPAATAPPTDASGPSTTAQAGAVTPSDGGGTTAPPSTVARREGQAEAEGDDGRGGGEVAAGTSGAVAGADERSGPMAGVGLAAAGAAIGAGLVVRRRQVTAARARATTRPLGPPPPPSVA